LALGLKQLERQQVHIAQSFLQTHPRSGLGASPANTSNSEGKRQDGKAIEGNKAPEKIKESSVEVFIIASEEEQNM
jgi:hypothetical protein